MPETNAPGDTTQYLDCLNGGRRVVHLGSFDRASGVVDALEVERGTVPDSVEVIVGWDADRSLLEGPPVLSVSGTIAAADAINTWELDFALTAPCTVGGSAADFQAGNTDEKLERRARYEAPVRPDSGVIVTGCIVELVSPPDGVLELSRADLPAWMRGQLVTDGALIACVGPPASAANGDTSVLLDGLPVVRVGDGSDQGGHVETGSDSILVNGRRAAVAGSLHICPMFTGLVPHVAGPILADLADLVAACSGASDPVGFSRSDLPRDGRPCQARIDSLIDRIASGDRSTAPGEQTGFVIGHPQGQLPSVGQLEETTPAGSEVLQMDSTELEIGDTVVVGDDIETTEIARVADKGSVVLDRPLRFDHAADTVVFRVPGDTAQLILLLDYLRAEASAANAQG